MKIFAYIGSYRKKSSFSYHVVDNLLKNIADEYNINQEEIFLCSPDKYNIKQCIGCNQCFIKGSCSIDDDMKKIKSKMLDSDIVIFASPVYVHQVSGNFKTFIDRIGHWTHTMMMSGKIGISVSLSDNNGNQFVTEYISKIMQYLGISVISNIEIKVLGMSKSGLDSIIQYESKKIIKLIKEDDCPISSLQELYYQEQRNSILKKGTDIGEYERNVWLKNDVEKFNHYIDYFNSKRKYSNEYHYCDRCHLVFDSKICPNCNTKHTREVTQEDYCFLIEKETLWAEMLKEVLENNEIDYAVSPNLGAGLSIKIGIYSEKYKFYVPFKYFNKAKQITQTMFDQ